MNEDKLTQILVQQINVQLHNLSASIIAQTQYNDLINSIKGKPDFYFHSIEEDKISDPLFVVESKRLPSKTFKTEYVIGNKQNGGIERYKIEKHGFGLAEGGMIGFVESNDYSFWLVKINLWIEELSHSNKEWNISEQLNQIETSLDYSYLESKVIRTKSEPLILNHIWIDIQ